MDGHDDETMTPSAEETTPPENVPPTTPPSSDDGDLREIVNGLQTRIDELTETVSNLTPGVHADSTPVRKPWTHYGNRT